LDCGKIGFPVEQGFYTSIIELTSVFAQAPVSHIARGLRKLFGEMKGDHQNRDFREKLTDLLRYLQPFNSGI